VPVCVLDYERLGDICDGLHSVEALCSQRWVDGGLLVDGVISIFEVDDAINVKMIEDVPDETLAGLILHELGRFPSRGESVVWNDHRLICEAVTPTSILTVRIVRPAPEAQPVDS